MPKSKVRKKDEYSNPLNRTPVKVNLGPSSPVYVGFMLGFMLAGLLWLIVYYLAGDQVSWITNLGAWNFLIGFGLMVIGLGMTVKWR
jgi:uncharacterized membrane protein